MSTTTVDGSAGVLGGAMRVGEPTGVEERAGDEGPVSKRIKSEGSSRRTVDDDGKISGIGDEGEELLTEF